MELKEVKIPPGLPARRVPSEEAEALLERHSRLGTCPNCLAPVTSFAALTVEGEAGQRFGCEHCSPAVASITRQADAARLKQRN